MRTGKCQNFTGCPLATGGELITLADDAPFLCPECDHPLIRAAGPAGRKPIVIPVMILGGICTLVLTGAGAVYFQVLHLRQQQPSGQIGTSFEQAEIAGEHGEFLPSRHMPPVSPTPAASP